MTPEILLAQHAYTYSEEPFTLKSGQKSHDYIDCRKALLLPKVLKRLALDMQDQMEEADVRYPDFLGCVLTGAAPLLTILSMWMSLPGVWVRKEAKDHGTAGVVVAPFGQERAGCCYLIEDVITTGGSVIRAIKELHKRNIFVTDVFALVLRDPMGANNIYAEGMTNVHALTTLEAIKETDL